MTNTRKALRFEMYMENDPAYAGRHSCELQKEFLPLSHAGSNRRAENATARTGASTTQIFAKEEGEIRNDRGWVGRLRQHADPIARAARGRQPRLQNFLESVALCWAQTPGRVPQRRQTRASSAPRSDCALSGILLSPPTGVSLAAVRRTATAADASPSRA